MTLTYDNPATMSRECWQNGVLLYSYSAALLMHRRPIPSDAFFFGASIGPWRTGQIAGDLRAMVDMDAESLWNVLIRLQQSYAWWFENDDDCLPEWGDSAVNNEATFAVLLAGRYLV